VIYSFEKGGKVDILSVRSRVERGIKYLYVLMPNWRERIDADKLTFEESPRCIIGQLTGSYIQRRHLLGIASHEMACRHGFTAESEYGTEERKLEIKLLLAIWKEYVTTRL
jgi:hypothetical protein